MPHRLSVFGVCVVLHLAISPAVALEATEKKIDDKSAVHELTLAYPQFGVPAIDAELESFAREKADEFKAYLAERGEQDQPYSAQLEYTIARNDDQVLAILFSYSHYLGGAHPNMNQYGYNYVMPAGSRVYLPELFTKEGFKRVSELAIADLKPRLTGPDGMSDVSQIELGAGPYADNFEAFVLGKDELAIYFDAYQVAAYAAGPQEVHIPLAKLDGMMRPDPLAAMASFDCAKAKSVTEKAICADAEVARLDRRVADAYAWRLAWAQEDEKAGIKTTQRQWLTARDAACSAADNLSGCLIEQYSTRLKVLRMEAN
jgi:uncharacterized protein YecT (DUF1311 family)